MKITIGKTILSHLEGAFEQKATRPLIKSLINPYFRHPKEKVFTNALYRLNRDGLIKREGAFWKITKQGKNSIKNLISRPNYLEIKKNPKQNLIIIFDIPEKQRSKRNILRTELTALEFEPIQRSVWTGHGPIPEKFITYLKDLEILNYIHIFEIKSFGDIK